MVDSSDLLVQAKFHLFVCDKNLYEAETSLKWTARSQGPISQMKILTEAISQKKPFFHFFLCIASYQRDPMLVLVFMLDSALELFLMLSNLEKVFFFNLVVKKKLKREFPVPYNDFYGNLTS